MIIKELGHPIKRTEVKYFLLFQFLLGLILFFTYYTPSSEAYSVFTRTWGFNLFSFYTLPTQIFIFLLALLTIIPKTNSYLANGFSALASRLSKSYKLKYILFSLVALLSVFLFYELKVKYFFLGDFNLRLDQIMRRDFLKTEYLTMRILYWFASFGFKFGYSPMTMFIFYSCLAGGVFVFFCLLIADILGGSTLQKLFFFLGQISTCLILVFCGYIEVYSTPVVLLTMYIYFGLRYLKYKKQFFIVVIILLIAVAAHLLNVALVPSVFILWYFNNRSKVTFISSASNKKIRLVIGAFVLIAIYLAFNVKNNFVLALNPPPRIPDYMTFFSFKHFWETVNGQVLACGLSFVLMFIFLWKSMKANVKTEAKHYFLISISGCIFLIVIMANLQRGSGDWDIMAFTAVPLNILILLGINLFYKKNIKLMTYLQVCLIVLNSIQAGLWVHINHTDRSIKKLETMLVNDPGTYYSILSSVIQVAMIYRANNLIPETDAILLKACSVATDEDLRPCEMYAQELFERKRFEDAREFCENLVQAKKYVPKAFLFLIEYYQQHNDKEKLDYYVQRLFDAFKLQPDFYLSKAEPKNYLVLFEYLYNLELKKGNSRRLQEVNYAVKTLRVIKPNYIK